MPLALYVALAALAARRDRVDRDAIRMRRYSVAILAGASAGFASAGWQASLRLAETLPAAIEGRDIVVTGVVAGMPQQRPSGLRFRFVVDPDGAPPGVPALLALGWYAGFDEDAAPVQPREACAPASAGASRCGCASRTATSTRTASTTSSRYSYVRRAAPPPVLLASDAGHPVERLRQRVVTQYTSRCPMGAAGVLAALAVGDQDAIERDDWDLFRNAGVAHPDFDQRPARGHVRVARRSRRAAVSRRWSGGVARTLLPSLPEAAHDSQLRRDAGRGRRGARALRRLRPLARGTTAAGDADPARGSRGHLSPRRHHLRRLRREGRRRRRRQRRHRAADSVRPDPARHPGQRMARDGARPAPARDRAQPLHPRRLSRPGDPEGRRHSRRPGARQRPVPAPR